MKRLLFQSLIDIDKWNAARWTATAFLHDPSGLNPPGLGLVFENITAGRTIFTDLQERIGRLDRFEELYISVIEGDVPGEAPGYFVHITSDPFRTQTRLRSQGRDLTFDKAILISRFYRMTPAPGSPHLDRFKTDVRRHRRYSLIPVSAQLHPQFDCAIEKKEIRFRQALDIRRGDRDSVVFPEGYFGVGPVN